MNKNRFAALTIAFLLGSLGANLGLSPSARAVETAFEEDHGLPLVYLNVAVKAGSVSDPSGQSGISNFVGEMLLRGTRSKTKEQIDLAVDQMGARLDIDTRAEFMVLRGAVLSSQLEEFLGLLGELVTQSTFPAREIPKLKSEVISGLLEEQGSDAALSFKKFNRFLFSDHPYGNPLLGKLKDVERFTRADALRQYDRIVHDRNLLVVGTGDASTERIKSWAENLGKLRPAGKNSITEKISAPENASERKLLIVDKPGRTQTQIYIGQVGVKMTDPSYFALHLGNEAFAGNGFSARLMKEIRVKRGWTYGISGHFWFGTEPRSWDIHLYPAAKDSAAALAYTLSMIEELKKSGLTTEEFDFAQRSLVNGSGFMYNTPQKRVENKLLERTLDLPDGFMRSYGPALAQVKLEDVNRALADFLKPDRLVIEVLGTAKEIEAPIVKAASVSPKDVSVVPYTQD